MPGWWRSRSFGALTGTRLVQVLVADLSRPMNLENRPKKSLYEVEGEYRGISTTIGGHTWERIDLIPPKHERLFIYSGNPSGHALSAG